MKNGRLLQVTVLFLAVLITVVIIVFSVTSETRRITRVLDDSSSGIVRALDDSNSGTFRALNDSSSDTVRALTATSTTPSQISSTQSTNQWMPPQQSLHLYEKKMLGHLNYDVWKQPVGYLVDDLRIKRDFPNRPELRQTIDKLSVTFNVRDKDSLTNKYGHKIYGYLLPSKSGVYRLRVVLSEVTAACSVELWLSSDQSPLSTKLVASAEMSILERGDRGKNVNEDANDINLKVNSSYYFEFLEKAFDGKCVATIQWRKPGESGFHIISSKNFVMAVQLNGSKYVDGWPVVEELKGDLPSNHLQSHSRVKYIGDTVYNISDIDVLESCEFKSKTDYPRKLRNKYSGVWQVQDRESLVFPEDQTFFKNWKKPDKRNKYISKERADNIMELYRKAFTKRGKKGDVKLRKMEETKNGNSGSRFLLEVDIITEGEVLHTSEYVYLANGANSLCHTSNFQWKKNVDVYLIVAVKNLGVWVQHLIHNMEHIYKVTGDKNFELVIVDYHSEDMNLEPLLKSSSLPSLRGPFSRSGGLQAGLDYVKDPDSIVMTMDMHLAIPPGFVEYIRRHVVKGKMGFAPMFFRLREGFTEININGFWEWQTYGLMGMYKSDWKTCGGYDTKQYTTKWGGEDWDIVDKAVTHGIELFRIRYPGLMHYFHTRTGLWDNSKKS